jgi:hypothetical protein
MEYIFGKKSRLEIRALRIREEVRPH